MSNILDASAIISLIPSLLSSSDKSLNSPQDALAVLSHTILSALAFRLIAVDDSSSSSHSSTNALPAGWNSHGPGSYTFRYKHDQSSLEFVIKVSKLGSRTLINAIAVEVSAAIEILCANTNEGYRTTRQHLWIYLPMTLPPLLPSHTIQERLKHLWFTASSRQIELQILYPSSS